MNIKELSEYLERLEKTSSRIAITTVLAELFNRLDKNEIDKAVYMMLGGLAPQYEGVVFNVADKMLERAILKAYDASYEEVHGLYKELGDLGIVAESLARKRDSSLGIVKLHEKLLDIAMDEGEGSVDRKIEKLSKLLFSLDSLSARYVARIPIGKLRLGFSDKTLIDALSWMYSGDKSKAVYLERAYQVMPDVGRLARNVKIKGIDKATASVTPRVGTPIIPMLPLRLKSTVEMVKKMGRVAVEPKYDGLRVQIHYRKGRPVRAFTRNLNDISQMFPELDSIGKYINAESAILDSEAVGLDEKTKKFADFQTTMNRRRKHGILESAKDTPLSFQIFDVMFVGGKNLMNEKYETRRRILSMLIKVNDTFCVDEAVVTSDPAVIRDKHRELITAGLEGVIVKNYVSRYVPGRTGWRWVKMKEVEEARGKLADTVDAVIMGYTQGKGKRAVFGVGQFLAGILDNDQILTITKVGTGLTDEQFRELNARLKKIVVNKKPKQYEVHKDLEPDFWTLPEVVVELAADELTKSPKHTAGMALRFPRLVKFRDDKSAQVATTLDEIKKLYILQKS